MAKLAFALAVLLFFFAFSYAELPQNGVADPDLSSSLPDSNSKPADPTILLPVDKLETEPATAVESTPLEVEAARSGEDLPVSDAQTELRILRIRPINRRFARRGCRHARGRREISFGNDMIMSSGDERDREMHRIDDRRPIPARPMRFHRHGPPHREAVPWFIVNRHNDDAVFVKHSFRKPFHHEHHHRHEEQQEKKELDDIEEAEEEEGSFLKHFRKILNQFYF